MFLQQKSKATWIRMGDDNTQYFYSVIKHRRLQQEATQLKDHQGNWYSDSDVIANSFVNYYDKDLLGRKASVSMPAFMPP